MTVILVTCRRCGAEFAPDHRAIVAGTWRWCEDCRDEATPHGPVICPTCHRVLKSGKHRNGVCPGRRGRRRRIAERLEHRP